jgi:predicted RNA-binding protein YlxR (DUF448 family)
LGLAAAIKEDALRDRRCIVTGESLSDAALVRFVVGPDSAIVPDVEAKLPGRGIWVTAKREAVARAVEKNLFSRAAKAPVVVSADLPDRVEVLLVRRMLADLGLARRAGELVSGFDNVLRALEAPRPPALLLAASDAARDGRRKLGNAAHARGLEIPVLDVFSSEELSLALGRGNVIHAALKSGRLQERLLIDAERLSGFRSQLSGNERDA